jgi:hypothetical protein
MSKKILLHCALVLVFAGTLSGCSSLRASLQNRINSTATPSETLEATNTQTAETYESVQKVRSAPSDKDAVSVTAAEVEAALLEADSVGSAEVLNTTDVGL